MDSYQRTLAELCEILAGFAEDGASVREDSLIATDLGLDSPQVMDLLLEIEERFDVSVPLNVLPDINTVGDLAAEIEKQAGAP